jgi:polyhydroxyalkanoate synthase
VPWRSAFASARLLGGAPVFVLGASGHIAGAINPPGRNKRNYWVGEKDAKLDPDASLDPDAWLARAESRPGSWWRHWSAWLEPHGGARREAPAHSGNSRYPSIGPAPGTYVREPSGPVLPAAPGAPATPFPGPPAMTSGAPMRVAAAAIRAPIG